jgi:hypothetical protein
LPQIAKVDPDSAHAIFADAVKRLPAEKGIVRTQSDYLKFLRETWPILSTTERRSALGAAFTAIPHPTNTFHWHIEYYTPSATVRLDSEEDARVYDLLPLVRSVDPTWEQNLRRQYPALANAPIDQPVRRASDVAQAPERVLHLDALWFRI